MPGLAHADRDRRRPLDLDHLLAERERRRPVRGEITPGIGGIEPLDEQVLDIGAGIGQPPGGPAVVAEHDRRQAGKGRADQLQPGRLQVRQVPDARRLQPEMGIVREQGRPGPRPAARQHPGVGALPGRGRRRQDGRQRVQPEAFRQRGERDWRIRRILRPDVGDLLVREPRAEPRAQQLVLVVGAEVERHHPQPDQAVGGGPGLDLMVPENQELGRQRPAPALQVSVDAGGIGLEPGPRRGAQVLEARGRPPVEPERAHEAVGRQRRPAHDLGQAPGADPPLELHLPEPVLGVDEAEGEDRILQARRLDMRDRPLIAHDRDRRSQPLDPDLAIELRQRLPQPQIAAARPGRAQRQQSEQPPAQPAGQAAQLRPARSRFRAGPGPGGADRAPGSGSHRSRVPWPRRRSWRCRRCRCSRSPGGRCLPAAVGKSGGRA